MSTSGDIMNTSGDVPYIGGYHDECGGYHVYNGGCSVHRGMFSTSRDTMCTSGGYHEYNRRSSVHRKDIMTHVGEQLDKILSISIENSADVLMVSSTCIMISPDVLNIPQQGFP